MKTSKNNSEIAFKHRVLKVGVFSFFMLFFSLRSFAEESLEEAQAHAERNELLSYIFMGLGIVAVILIAVVTIIKGRKSERNAHSGVKPIVSHRPFTHKYDHHHGRRGAQVRRR